MSAQDVPYRVRTTLHLSRLNPQLDMDEDGALVVHFEDDSGRQQALVVPIVIR